MNNLAGYVALSLLAAFSVAAAEKRVTVGRCAEAPVIDGQLGDACWQTAAALSGLVQIRPGDNAPPSRETTVLLARDAKTLYVAVRATDEPSRVRATMARRDDVLADDHVTLYLDTFDDRRRAYVLTVNPLGVQQDGIYAEGREIDYSLDLVLQSKGELTAGGYAVEIALPFSSLRYRSGAGSTWGLHVERRILHLDEELSWMPRIRGNANLLAQAGALDGMDDLPSSRMLEVIPGVTVEQSGARRTSFETQPVEGDPSVTMKLALASDLVVDATVNPDFAQIESDQLVSTANQRFPIFFAEKRPFFLEGIDLFQTPLNAMHSRAIIDPDYATKATGKRGKTTFGLLLASDNAPGAFTDEERDDPALRRFAGKNATAGVLRIRRDIGQESFLGAIATSYDFVDTHGRLAGVDGRLTLDRNTVLSFQLLGTFTENGGRGLGFFAQWKRSGRHVSVTVEGEGRTPGYRADLGFTTQTDTNRWSVLTRYDSEPRPEARVLLSWSFLHTALAMWDWDGRIKYAYVYPRIQMNFRRQTRVTLFAYADYLRLFEEEFGRPFHGEPERSTIYKGLVLDLQTAPSKKIAVGLTVDRAWDFFDYDFGAPPRFPRVSPPAIHDPDAPLDPGTGRTLSITARLELQPTDALRITFDHGRNRLVRTDTGRVAFDERLYSTQATYQFTNFVFARGRVDYASLHANVRGQLLLGWTPSPGTALYAGYTDDLTRDDGLLRNRRSVFVKASYLVRRAW